MGEFKMIKKLTNNIYYMPYNDDTVRPTLGLICGKNSCLVVDSGNSPNHAKEFIAEVKLMDIPPMKYLALTHYHYDHTFGIKEMNLITIAHEKTKQEIEKMKQLRWDDASLDKLVEENIFDEFCCKCIKKEIVEREKFTIGDVDIVYNDSIRIDLGDLTCVIKSVAGSHTDDSTIIYVPEDKVMFLGDCAYVGRINGLLAYDKEKLFKMIDIIQRYDVDYYVLSHDTICDRKDIIEYWNQLKMVEKLVGKDTSIESINKRFIDELCREPSDDESFFINCFINANKVLD